MRTSTIYIAFDGERFDSVEDCKAHEAAHVETRLVGLTQEQVRAALNREDTELADAIEERGNRIRRARLDAGDLKRGRKATVDGDAAKPVVDALTEADVKMAEALSRARIAGLAAWHEKKGAVVPESFAGMKPLHDAWLDGWRSGQAEAGAARAAEAA